MAESNGTLAGYTKILVLSLSAGALGAGGLAQIAPEAVRPDPFTSEDADSLKDSILKEVARQAEIDHIRLMQGIPPDSVRDALSAQRRRLYHIEEEMRRISPTFAPAPDF